ncbi:multiheme c-type cytochrome [Roseimaritima ulvae]|uniref:Cytochrome c-552/4 domain-containing protein n=1 Tax=Roseimaritima ulvae TaxID=980254 RepID=A0A5B9R044_9BACT|nr:multiheme c-type cytochrome [Roseimaritima ulvae]QEG43590.1 hypothetical protein UC8_56410 [Roseimaritima ulvae]
MKRLHLIASIAALLAICVGFALLIDYLTKPSAIGEADAVGEAGDVGGVDGGGGAVEMPAVAANRGGRGAADAAKTAPQLPRVFPRGKLLFWWDKMPAGVEQVSFETGPPSNIHPDNYVGYESCQQCHKQNYQDWSVHPHRWMNALADDQTVKGDFSGKQTLRYLGGEARFEQQQGVYQMTLERDGVTLVYAIDQTLGSRFYQYYIGRLVDGPFAPQHPYRTENHVLPFGYWLQKEAWVPVVHVGPERPDGERTDPFVLPETPDYGVGFLPYATYCNMCHSTFPLGDNMFRKPFTLEKHSPAIMHLDMAGYIQQTHPELWPAEMSRDSATMEQIESIPAAMTQFDARDHAATFGISCEACHLGCQEHVRDPKKLPSFAPRSEHLRLENGQASIQTGRVHENLNWACGRCHTGERPQFAGGMSTWNSTEYSDAMLGSCYSQLNCVDCHSPHKATGTTWTPTPMQDDAKCITCHQQYGTPQAVAKHTHHAADSAGSRCMNCHMPKINEGLQDVVRTHTIFSPTQPQMLESNHPNACNLCHTDQPIDWTTKYLAEWYGGQFDEAKMSAAYSDPQQAVGLQWLASENEAVRLVAIDAMRRNRDVWAAPQLIEMLDDPYLLNRQFAQQAVEEILEIDLKEYGYTFYMTPEERAEPIKRIRERQQ